MLRGEWRSEVVELTRTISHDVIQSNLNLFRIKAGSLFLAEAERRRFHFIQVLRTMQLGIISIVNGLSMFALRFSNAVETGKH